MGRFKLKPQPTKDPLEEAFEKVWRASARNNYRMLPPEHQESGRSGVALLHALQDVRKGIQLALAKAAVPQMKNEPTMDLFSGGAEIPFTLLRLGTVPRFILVDQDEAYERKCVAVSEHLELIDQVDFLKRHILPALVEGAMRMAVPDDNELIAGIMDEIGSMALPLPDTRQVTMISTGIGLPEILRGRGTMDFLEALSGMMEEGPGEFISRLAANSRHLHISSIGLGDTLWHLSEVRRRVVIVDQPHINIPNLEEAVREHIETELEKTDGHWEHIRTEQRDPNGTIISELRHE